MKRAITIQYLSPLLILFIISQSVFGQCNRFTRKTDLSLLEKYESCGGVKAAQMYPADSAIINLQLIKRKKYRILLAAQDYLGEPKLEVLNASNEVISIELKAEGQSYWELFAEEKETVALKIKFQSRNQDDHDINAAGCVVLAVGQIGLDELVDNEGESDL